MSHFERPIFPASYHNVGTVPKIAPIKNHRATLSISPSIKLIKNDSKKIPITAPIPTGIKKRTFALKFFNGLAINKINRSYNPNTAAKAPPLMPGKINPDPINAPLTARKILSPGRFCIDYFLISFNSSCISHYEQKFLLLSITKLSL